MRSETLVAQLPTARSSLRPPVLVGYATSLLLMVSASGCGVSLGPAAITDVHPHSATQLGAAGSFRAYPGSSQGLVLGGGATVAPKLQDGSKWKGWAEGALGYAVLPLAQTSPVGIEATVGPAAGVMPTQEKRPFSAGWSFRLAMPYRVSRGQSAWEVSSATQSLAYIVPEGAIVQTFPVGSGLDHGAITQLLFSVSFRYEQWLSIIP